VVLAYIGLAIALNGLGGLHEVGGCNGIAIDLKKSLEYYQKAAKAGWLVIPHCDACACLLFTLAVIKNSGNGMFDAGRLLANGIDGSEPDYKESLVLLKKAADTVSDTQSDAAAAVGDALFHAHEIKEAITYWIKAWEIGGADVVASSIAAAYEVAPGDLKDEKLAFEWYLKGSERGVASCSFHAGRCYWSGIFAGSLLCFNRSSVSFS
jgi:TPR repeat protein